MVSTQGLAAAYAPLNPYKHYVIIARGKPTKEGESTPILRMKIFAPNSVVAKSRFWYFVSRLHKVKKANGEILHITEVVEKDTTQVKNYGVWIRYNSRSGIHNMYKEYRDVSLVGAVNQMYTELASRHKARFSSIHILKTAVVADDKVRRTNTLQYIGADLKFPVIRNVKKVDKKYDSKISFRKISKLNW